MRTSRLRYEVSAREYYAGNINHGLAGHLTAGCLLLGLLLSPASIFAAVVDEFHQAPVIETGRIGDMSGLVETIGAHRVVLVGETHPSVEDHMLQMHVLETMASQGTPLVMAVEWFQRPYQEVLDQYIAGTIDERTFLQDSEYFHRWGFDYRLYRPMMRYARKAGIPVLALNIEREITDSIMQNGIEGLPENMRSRLPADYDFGESDYTRLLSEMGGAPADMSHRMNSGFGRFLEVQLTWDEAMAEQAANYLQANPETRMVIFAGRGHVHAGAIPQRLQSRTGLQTLSIMNFSPATPFNNADYLVLGKQEALPPAGSLGITVRGQDDGRVFVKDVSPYSEANAAGVQQGDQILAIDDYPVRSFTDLKYALIDGLPGDVVRLLLLRDVDSDQEQSLRVQLRLGQ